MSIFQYQGLAEPLTVSAAPTAPALSWLASYPDSVPRHAIGQTWPTYPLQPESLPALSWQPVYPDRTPVHKAQQPDAELVVLQPSSFLPQAWWPILPDQRPRGVRPTPGQGVLVTLPPTVPTFWEPSYPAKLPPFRRMIPPWFIPPDFFPGFVPIAPTLPGRWAPRGPTYAIQERASGRYSCQLVAADGVTPLPGTLLTSLTLTLYMIDTGDLDQIVNGRDRQNVLNANNVTISPSGRITWIIQPSDTVIGADTPFERHLALFEWTWPGGSHAREVLLIVQNLRRVP